MMKIKFLFVVPALNIILPASRAQNSAIVPMDESMQQLIDFYQTDTKMNVIPEGDTYSKGEKTKTENFAFWNKHIIYRYKAEYRLQKIEELNGLLGSNNHV
ncbi:MAG: hypothetical protein JXR22_06615 [Prolixibacteraceae bacterium]|nr:hypothetical protein [Prolixibacteraceae bacterium]